MFEREIHLRVGGQVAEAQVTIGMPVQEGPRGDWRCEVYVSRIMGRPIKVHGLDALGAITTAVHFVEDLLSDHRETGWESWWLEEGDGAGFP